MCQGSWDCSSCSVGISASYLSRGKQKQDTGRSSSLGLRPREEASYCPQGLKLLPQLQAADSSFFSRKDFPWYLFKLWKIIQLVSGAEKTGSLIYSNSLENVPLFSAVRMGGNFSTSIITEDISGHHYLRSLRKIKILPRPKVSLESEISSERKGFRSNGHLCSLILLAWITIYTLVVRQRSRGRIFNRFYPTHQIKWQRLLRKISMPLPLQGSFMDRQHQYHVFLPPDLHTRYKTTYLL